MKCSRCFDPLDTDLAPTFDAFTGGLVCEICHESEVDYRDDANFPEGA